MADDMASVPNLTTAASATVIVFLASATSVEVLVPKLPFRTVVVVPVEVAVLVAEAFTAPSKALVFSPSC